MQAVLAVHVWLLFMLLQDMCIVLELRDATLLVASLKKVAAVASAIPSVEAFVAQVGLLADNQPPNCTPVACNTQSSCFSTFHTSPLLTTKRPT